MSDKISLRGLASRYAEFARSDENREKIRLHRAVNDLEMIRPIVLIDELPWEEMEIEDELALQCEDEDYRRVEQELRRSLYKRKHMPADLALPDYIGVEKVIYSTGIGVEVEEERLGKNNGGISSHKYHNIFREKGLEMLHDPVITYDEKETLRRFMKIAEAVGDILPVKITGQPTGYDLGCKTWDTIAMLMGAEDLLIGLAEEPAFMHQLVQRLTDIFLHTVKQYEEQNLIDMEPLYCHSASASASGMGKAAGDYEHNNLKKVWGRGLAQILAAVSPAMHDEFDIQYMIKAMEPFGYVYYGCCEPLDRKIDILEQIPNLRKISITPWADINTAAERIGSRYVISCKPNPAQLSLGKLNRDAVYKELAGILSACRKNNCSFELVLKDISTVNGKPECLFEWERIAMEVAEGY